MKRIKVEGGRLFRRDGMVWRDAGPAPPRRRARKALPLPPLRAHIDNSWAAVSDFAVAGQRGKASRTPRRPTLDEIERRAR